MKLNSAMSKFLTNKWVLNIVAFLAILNVIGYAVMGQLNNVLYFIVFAVLVRYFSKNMIIVLGVPLIIVNLLSLNGNMVEGMENNIKSTTDNSRTDSSTTDSSTTDSSTTDNSTTDNSTTDNKKHTASIKKATKSNAPDTISSQGLTMSSIASSEMTENNAAQSTGGEQQGFEPGRRKNRGYDIDYATTIEDAYDELNNILGSDGIQRLTSDTQNLMKQQMQLAESMKGMGQLVQNIQPMVEQLKGMMGDTNGGINGVMELAKKFSGQPAPAK
jgi:hypothetical protein